MTRPDNQQWEFGPFRLDGAQHLLFRDGKIVPLSRKATDMLLVLLEHQGHLVEKEVLMRRVWPDSFVEESNLAVHISQLRKTLTEEGGPYRIETIPRRGYRFIGQLNSEKVPEAAPAILPQELPAATPIRQPPRLLPTAIAAVLLIAIASVALHLYRSKLTAPLNVAPAEKDTVVLADIANNTGDPVFDTTLRQAMAIELEQSPFLRLVPESRIQQTVKLMGKSSGQPLTPDLWRELCQRTGSEAVLDGWIAKLGTQYVLSVRAVNCRTGDHIADLQTTAAGKEQVLKALGDITGQLRAKLGESLATVQRFDTPIEEATTPSLEALQAYSIGKAMVIQKDESSAGVPFFQRAIRLDPDFAIAYAALGNAYSNLGETGLAATNMRRAYELRAHVSEHERLYIESHYYQFATGDLPKAAAIYENWAATYPDDVVPRTDLALIDSNLGKFVASLDQAKAALRIAPDDTQNYANLVNHYISFDSLNEARAVIDRAVARNLDCSDLHLYLYDIAFLQHDVSGMAQQMKWSAGEPGFEDLFLGHNANTLAFDGKDAQAAEFTGRATEAARRAGEKETAAGYELDAAQREALFGNPAEAKRLAGEALTLASDRDTKYGAALALALAGAVAPANAIVDQLNNDFPDDTFVQYLYLPTIRAAVALQQKDPARAAQVLEASIPYELGVAGGLVPVYVRGLAYLASGESPRAEAEFQKVIANPGVVLNSPIGPLSRLQLARAYALEGDSIHAKAAYQDFLARWKDADPTLPILRAAKAEYAKQ